MKAYGWLYLGAAFLAGMPGVSASATAPEYTIIIKDHQFQPSVVTVPSGQKVKLVIDNQDGTAEEFESHSLKREKVINGGSKATIYIGPLKPGKYEFVGEYHEKTARGAIVVK